GGNSFPFAAVRRLGFAGGLRRTWSLGAFGPDRWCPLSPRSRTIPGVKDIKTTVLEVCHISRRQLGPSHLRNGRYLRVRVADRSAEHTPVSGNLRKNSR